LGNAPVNKRDADVADDDDDDDDDDNFFFLVDCCLEMSHLSSCRSLELQGGWQTRAVERRMRKPYAGGLYQQSRCISAMPVLVCASRDVSMIARFVNEFINYYTKASRLLLLLLQHIDSMEIS